jgi:hypothetical protein
MPLRRSVLFVAACALAGPLVLASARSGADAAAPLRLELVGSESVRARAAIGSFMPCDSKENEQLWEGVVQPGFTEIATGAACVCVQQTFAPLINVGWTVGAVRCRPHDKRRRHFDYAKPIDVTLTSREP